MPRTEERKVTLNSRQTVIRDFFIVLVHIILSNLWTCKMIKCSFIFHSLIHVVNLPNSPPLDPLPTGGLLERTHCMEQPKICDHFSGLIV